MPAGNLVGVEGAAFAQTMRQLEHERGRDRPAGVEPGAAAVGARRTPTATIRSSARRSPAWRPGTGWAGCWSCGACMGQAPAGFSAATKCVCTEYEQRVADFVARVAGARAMLWDDLGVGLAYAPAYTIMGGTSNVMRNIVAERILGLPR